MANTIIRISSQINELYNTPKRMIVQYNDGVDVNTASQNIVNYDNLTVEEQATFDAYQVLAESKMI